VRSIPRARSATKDHAIGPPLPMGQPAQNVPYPMRVFIYDDVAPALNRNLQVCVISRHLFSSMRVQCRAHRLARSDPRAGSP